MKSLLKTIMWITVFFTSLTASAQRIDIKQQTVAVVGTHEGDMGYLALAGAIHANCNWGAIYFDISTTLGKTYLSTLYIAKTTKQKIQLVYDVPAAAGQCKVAMIGLQ
ncbi:MAG: hypothetical protein ABL933_13455 [Methyloglobulus sp.]